MLHVGLQYAIACIAAATALSITGALLRPTDFMRLTLCIIAIVLVFQAVWGFRLSITPEPKTEFSSYECYLDN